MNNLWYFALLTSLVCGTLIILHGVYPQFMVDTTTDVLVLIMILPWLIPYVKTVKFPGGGEIDFKDEAQHIKSLVKKSKISKVVTLREEHVAQPQLKPTYTDLVMVDPNLALASLRIDIERKLRGIAIKKGLPVEKESIKDLLKVLSLKRILGHSESETLSLITNVCNRAVHTEKIDTATALRILDLGKSVLSYLDSL
jgi:hypothetical protein